MFETIRLPRADSEKKIILKVSLQVILSWSVISQIILQLLIHENFNLPTS